MWAVSEFAFDQGCTQGAGSSHLGRDELRHQCRRFLGEASSQSHSRRRSPQLVWLTGTLCGLIEKREDNSHGCLLPVGCSLKAGMCGGFTPCPAAEASVCSTPHSWEIPSKINLVTPRSARRNRATPPHSGPLNEWNRGSFP